MARYELVERIGVGGMAEIFRGKAVAGGGFEKPVAIKRILPRLSQDKRFVELLITEAKTLSQLRHRNVVQIYDVGLGDDGQYFLVMEFVDGADLGAMYNALEKAGLRVPVEVALHVVGEVCEALDHAHRARSTDGKALGLVHRDVTPSNILLSCSGEVKLTDFGIAKRMEEATGHGGVRGKFAYISPEQAMNAHVDARSDVYALGVVLYELVLGRRLYSALPDFEALRAVREAGPLDLTTSEPELDRELATILETALAPAPADRFPSAGVFGATLRTYRYALESSVGDPATEIARMVEGHRRGHLEAATLLQREATVVRIATAAGFSGGFTSFNEGGGAAHLARGDLFDDEETRALSPATIGRMSGRELPFDDVETHPAAPSMLGYPDASLSDSSTSEPQIDAETRLMALSLPTGRASSHEVGPSRSRKPANEDEDEDEDEGGRRERAPTPTIREAFHRGELLADRSPRSRQPLASARRPGGDARMSASRRRAIVIAGSACIVCAVAAFVAVGLLLGDTPAPTPISAPDAAPVAPLDASAVSAPTDAGPAKVRRPRPDKRNKKRPTNNATGKKKRPRR